MPSAPRDVRDDLEIPALGVGDKEVAKSLDAGDRLEFFGIDEIGVERDRFGVAEQLHKPVLDEVVRQHRDAEPALAGAQNAEDIVDDEMRLARPLAVAGDLDQPPRWLQIRRYVAAEHQGPVRVEVLE